MGNYNPHAPVIWGNEFVPIDQENIVLDSGSDPVEYGYSFTLPAAQTVSQARVYMTPPLGALQNNQGLAINIYPRGLEASSGPMKSLIIPVAAASATVSGNSGETFVNAHTGHNIAGPSASSAQIADALQSPNSQGNVTLQAPISTDPSANNFLRCFFDMRQFLPQLVGRRVMAINVLLQIDNPLMDQQHQALGGFMSFLIESNSATVMSQVVTTSTQVQRFPLPNYSNIVPIGGARSTTNEMNPWTLSQLSQFIDGSLSTQLYLFFQNTKITIPSGVFTSVQSVVISYVALEIIYCDEQRVAVGGYGVDQLFSNIGMQPIVMRTLAGATNPSLPAGDYVVTVSCPSRAQLNAQDDVSAIPPIMALRQLYALPTMQGVEVDKPWPPWNGLGDTFSETVKDILPQISLHDASNNVIAGSQVYGVQVAAPVYGGITATQRLVTDNDLNTYSYFRYYARRFGNTEWPLTLTGAGLAYDLTPAAFDALPQIFEGWKEVTLRYTANSPTASGIGASNWVWSTNAQVTAGERWEVLAASALAVSGLPGNPLAVVPNGVLDADTYRETTGATQFLTWLGLAVSGVANDTTADATLMFSLVPPQVTGVACTQQVQPVTVPLDCGVNPLSIVTGISYNQVTWPQFPVGTFQDTFTRSVGAGGWGTPDKGSAYVLNGTASWFSVNGTKGVIAPANSQFAIASEGFGSTEQEIVVTFDPPPITGVGTSQGVVMRYINAANTYQAEINTFSQAGQPVRYDCDISITLGGVFTSLVNTYLPWMTATTSPRIRVQATADNLKLKVWDSATVEPVNWTLQAYDLQISGAAATGIGMFGFSNTFDFPQFKYDNAVAWQPNVFGAYELQRQDTFDQTWRTIMFTNEPTITSFNDYEARVGVQSSYRIRLWNPLGFVGDWSATVTGTVPAPGVQGRSVDNSVLLFTTNEHQLGGENVAYVENLQNTVEDASFPESTRTVLQWMYGKDFQSAFQPLERGGEAFARNLLGQNMFVAGPLLQQGFQTLRNLGWDDVNYVCVRNDIGDRWFANVNVTGAQWQHNRQIANVDVVVTETFTVPTQVDPAVSQ